MAALSLSDKLRQTSDDLTRMVRLYAVNGDPVYREYFDEILAIRNGEAPRPVNYFTTPYWDIVLNSNERFGEPGPALPIRTLADRAGMLEEENALLQQAEDASNALAVIENEIMEVIAAGIEAADGDYLLKGDTLVAMQRLHSQEYHAARALVMQPLVELERLVQEQYDTWINGTIGFISQSLFTGYHAIIAAFLLLAASIWQIRR